MKNKKRWTFKYISEKIFSKREILFLFLFFVFHCSSKGLSEASYQEDRKNKMFADLITKKFSNVEETSTNRLMIRVFKINTITVEDIKKLDNINITEDALIESLPEPKIELTDVFKRQNIGISIVKNSVTRDKTKDVFSYRVDITQNGLSKTLSIEYKL